MPEFYDVEGNEIEVFDEQGSPFEPPKDSSTIRKMREELKTAKDEIAELKPLAEEGEKVQREQVFKDAGVPLDTDAGKLFVDAYKGDMTVEAVKTAAEPYKSLFEVKAQEEGEAKTPETKAGPTDEEKAAAERAHQATSGAAPGAPGPDSEAPYRAYDEAMERGSSKIGAIAAAVRVRMNEPEPEKE